ncbi:MAG: mechanosensitive ion channel family protein [Desulfurococcaceae archaeon]
MISYWFFPIEWVNENLVHLSRYLGAIIIFIVFYYIGKIVANKVFKIKTITTPEFAYNIAKTTRILFTMIGLLAALSIIGIDLGGLLIAAGFTGIVVGLAAQQTLGNLFSGLAMLFEGRVKIGDIVKINDNFGVVEHVGLLSTRIRLFSGEILLIPNSVLFNTNIYNYSSSIARRIEISIGISYRSDLNKALEIIRNELWENPLILAEPEPVILVDTLGESSVNLKIMFWVPSQYFLKVRSNIIGILKEKLENAGIEIPFPQRIVWLRTLDTTDEREK